MLWEFKSVNSGLVTKLIFDYYSGLYVTDLYNSSVCSVLELYFPSCCKAKGSLLADVFLICLD